MIKRKLNNLNKNLLVKTSFVLLSNLTLTTLAFANQNDIASNRDFDKSIEICEKSISEYATTQQLINNIGNLNLKCFNKLATFEKDKIAHFIDQKSMLEIAKLASKIVTDRYNQIKDRLKDENFGIDILTESQRDELLKYSSILNNAYYIHSITKNSTTNKKDDENLKKIIADIAMKFSILTYNQNITGNEKDHSDVMAKKKKFRILAKEVFALIGSSKGFEENLDLIKYITKNSDYITNKDTLSVYSILPIQMALASSHDAGGIYFKNKANQEKFIKILENIRNIIKSNAQILNIRDSAVNKGKDLNESFYEDPKNKKNINESFYENYILELGKFLRYKEYQPVIVDTLKFVINNTTGGDFNDLKLKPSTFWLEATSALEYYKLLNFENCAEFTDKNGNDACKVISKLSKSLFKNRYIYDEGAIIIYTALSKNEADKIYFSMKQVESQFKQGMQLFNPIVNDKNNRLYVYIYPTRQDYMDYKPYASDLDKQEDGGVYIDSKGAFYTFAGNEYLEDYVKHEYVHYLNSRYLYKNFAQSKNTVKAWQYMDWFVEGSADFFAGAKKDGIGITSLRYNAFTQERSKQTIIKPVFEILDSKYESEYSDRFLFTHFLYNKEKDTFDSLVQSIKTNNVNSFMKIINSLLTNNKLNNDFIYYVNNLHFNESDKAKINSNIDSFFAGKKEFEDSFKELNANTSCSVVASSDIFSDFDKPNEQARVSCKVNVAKDDQRLFNLIKTDLHSQTNCSYLELQNAYICEGSVSSARRTEIAPDLIQKIDKVTSEQYDRIFPVINDNYNFFTGDIYSSTLAKGNREEGWYYTYYVNNNETDLKVDEDGEYSFKKINGYDKITKNVTINGNNVELTFLRFEEFDRRMFAKNILVQNLSAGNGEKYAFASHSLYRNEASIEDIDDGFRVFDSKFRYDEVNDFDFKEDTNSIPEGATVEVSNRYILRYVNYNPKEGDSVKFNVSKHGKNLGKITLNVVDKIKSKHKDEISKNPIEIAQVLNIEVDATDRNKINYKDIFIYNYLDEGMIEPGILYNYTFKDAPTCHTNSNLREDGHLRFVENKECDILKEELVVAISRVTNNGPFHEKNIKIIYTIQK
ncbi:collagenase [Fluviispira multicolorata]|uniref:Microbial collagenase n=1 Tax=Fluviispira multicolorata TaxID=2654512 RepID=A0A833JGN6_9BACT|nr:collagenase [Fluviispira multicolorata]KAB8032161.1 hypothetical protein GCL57_05810 [Fluviispira multicolorata]